VKLPEFLKAAAALAPRLSRPRPPLGARPQTQSNPESMETKTMPPTEFTETKPFLASKGVLGGLGSILTIAVGALGYTVTEADSAGLVLAVTGIVSSVNSLIGIYGRVKATRRIG